MFASEFIPPSIDIRIRKYKNGQVVHDQSEVGHSFVRNAFMPYFHGMLGSADRTGLTGYGPELLGVKDFGGTVRTANSNTSVFQFPSGSTNASQGLVLGTSDAPFSIENHTITAPSWHTIFPFRWWFSFAENLSSFSFHFEKGFLNLEAEARLIKEVGLVSTASMFGTSTNYLLARDVLETPVSVEFDERVDVNYTATFSDPDALSAIFESLPFWFLSPPRASSSALDHLDSSLVVNKLNPTLTVPFTRPLGATTFCVRRTWSSGHSTRFAYFQFVGYGELTLGPTQTDPAVIGRFSLPSNVDLFCVLFNLSGASNPGYDRFYEIFFEDDLQNRVGWKILFGHGPDSGFFPAG